MDFINFALDFVLGMTWWQIGLAGGAAYVAVAALGFAWNLFCFGSCR